MKKGRILELTVATLEKALCSAENIQIVSPYMVPDKTDPAEKRLREHDVAIIRTDTHHKTVIALECRDRSRPITREHVEAFARKCQDTGVHKGVIVSATGFRKTAIKKAGFLEIECLSLKDVADLGWLQTNELSIENNQIRTQRWTFFTEAKLAVKPADFVVVDSSGKKIPDELFTANVHKALRAIPGLQPGLHQRTMNFATKDWSLIDGPTGIKHKLAHAIVAVEFEVIHTIIPFKKLRYTNERESSSIAEAAVAGLPIGDIEGQLMIMNKGGNVELHYIPVSPK